MFSVSDALWCFLVLTCELYYLIFYCEDLNTFSLQIRLKTHQCLWFPPALCWRAVQWLWSAAVMQIQQWTTPGPEREKDSWSSCRLETLLPSKGPTRHTEAGTTVQLRTNMAPKTHQWSWTFSVSNKGIEKIFQPSDCKQCKLHKKVTKEHFQLCCTDQSRSFSLLDAPQISPSSSCSRTDVTVCFCEADGNPSPELEWHLSGRPVTNSSNTFISEERLSSTGLRSSITLHQSLTHTSTLQCVSNNTHGTASQLFHLVFITQNAPGKLKFNN